MTAPLMTLPWQARLSPQERRRLEAERTQTQQPPTQAPRPAQQVPGWLPMCGKCRQPVARMSWTADPKTREQLFRAECHGQAWQKVIPWELALSGPMEITGGTLFQPESP